MSVGRGASHVLSNSHYELLLHNLHLARGRPFSGPERAGVDVRGLLGETSSDRLGRGRGESPRARSPSGPGNGSPGGRRPRGPARAYRRGSLVFAHRAARRLVLAERLRGRARSSAVVFHSTAGQGNRGLSGTVASGTTYAPTNAGTVRFDPARVATYRGVVLGTMTAPLQGGVDAVVAIIDLGSEEIRAHLGPSA